MVTQESKGRQGAHPALPPDRCALCVCGVVHECMVCGTACVKDVALWLWLGVACQEGQGHMWPRWEETTLHAVCPGPTRLPTRLPPCCSNNVQQCPPARCCMQPPPAAVEPGSVEATKRDYGPIMAQFVLPGKPSGAGRGEKRWARGECLQNVRCRASFPRTRGGRHAHAARTCSHAAPFLLPLTAHMYCLHLDCCTALYCSQPAAWMCGT